MDRLKAGWQSETAGELVLCHVRAFYVWLPLELVPFSFPIYWLIEVLRSFILWASLILYCLRFFVPSSLTIVCRLFVSGYLGSVLGVVICYYRGWSCQSRIIDSYCFCRFAFPWYHDALQEMKGLSMRSWRAICE